MPGCVAIGCKNQSEKGYIMKCFSRDPIQRKTWTESVARTDWEPSDNSFLCHIYFEPQQWIVTQTGRIRLSRNTVPSIFSTTSFRKSVRKKGVCNTEVEFVSVKDFEKNRTYSVTKEILFKHCEESIRDILQNTMESEKKKCSGELQVKKDPDVQEDVVMISNDAQLNVDVHNSQATEVNNKSNQLDTLENTENAINVQACNTVVKEEVKSEITEHAMLHDSYDEIEEKLKQICDGGSNENENYTEEVKANLAIKESEEKENITNEFENCKNSVDVRNNSLKKNESEHRTTDKEEVEIIFGKESGDEKGQSMPAIITSSDKSIKGDDIALKEIMAVKEEKKVFAEDIEENFTKDEVHVIPNMKAAMKRKRRTREEIMKSIKKSIKSTSDQELDTTESSELSDIEPIIDSKSVSPAALCKIQDANPTKVLEPSAKFVIKITGDPTDVNEIMDELSSNSLTTCHTQKLACSSSSMDNQDCVTSIITLYSPLDVKESLDSDHEEREKSPTLERVSNIESIETQHQCESSYTKCREPVVCCEDEDRNLLPSAKAHTHCCRHGTPSVDTPIATPSPTLQNHQDLLERLNIQEKVISQLVDQLIIYKEFENDMKRKNSTNENSTRAADTPTHKMNTRSSTAQSSSTAKKNLESKQRLIEDLSNRVNYFEEMNKKLMKTVTLESQQKRKLEGQIKQKDNRIKELNWKLEKASKYLERAEKNTNTYRRKMLNMQTIMRRKKLLDEKMTKFNEMLGDTAKQEFSEKEMAMAVEIRKTCGAAGYEKLLACGFPLPSLSIVQTKFVSEDITDYNESDVENRGSKLGKHKDANAEIDVEKNESKVSKRIRKDAEFDGAETVTGTVQDIFEENNEGDDFSTNELREHFILQLNAVM